MAIKAVVFDFGGVLIDWNPEYVYKRLIPDDTERRWFLDNKQGFVGRVQRALSDIRTSLHVGRTPS